jgi:hypothetical protein
MTGVEVLLNESAPAVQPVKCGALLAPDDSFWKLPRAHFRVNTPTWSKAMTTDDDDTLATCDIDHPEILELVVDEALIATKEAAGPWPERAEECAAYFARQCELIRAHDPRLADFTDEELYWPINGFPFGVEDEETKRLIQGIKIIDN